MNMEIEPQGNIHISKQTIATIAFQAVQRSYGVVGLASRNIVDGLTHALVKDPTHGIDVEYKNDLINIDLYIIIEYGTRIKSVAASVANTVRYQVEKTLGLPVNEVNVHVQGLRISNLD
ncbi:MAG: Asp23/Gls24 family envelope stress response protein [Anaerolineales bacterium]|nr:Asp23/Gls24 family envelope stress response protein [Anaerolineales bacterium]